MSWLKAGKIVNGEVVDVVRFQEGSTLPEMFMWIPEHSGIGWVLADGALSPPPPPPPPPPTVDDVRAEAQRRLLLLTGARDRDHLNIIIQNANREAIRLLRKGPENWTAEEATRAAELQQYDAAIEFIRYKSNLLEVMDPVPDDYASDKHWT